MHATLRAWATALGSGSHTADKNDGSNAPSPTTPGPLLPLAHTPDTEARVVFPAHNSGDDEQQQLDAWRDTATAGEARRFDWAAGEYDALVEWFRAGPSRAAGVQ